MNEALLVRTGYTYINNNERIMIGSSCIQISHGNGMII